MLLHSRGPRWPCQSWSNSLFATTSPPRKQNMTSLLCASVRGWTSLLATALTFSDDDMVPDNRSTTTDGVSYWSGMVSTPERVGHGASAPRESPVRDRGPG